MTTEPAVQVPIPHRSAPRIEADWFVRFGMQLRTTQTLRDCGGETDVVLLGDSITEGWQWSSTWGKAFAGLKVLNYGIGGDRTENLLWRIENGLLDALRPRVVTLMVGVNDLWISPVAADVVTGVVACAKAIHARLPYARLVHFGILPTSGSAARVNPLVQKINAKCAKAAGEYNATWIDLTPDFCTKPGELKPGLLSDGVHLLDAGYQIWGDKLRPLTE